MSPLTKKAIAVVLIYLTASPSLISPYLTTMVLAEGKGETWEEFMQRTRGELEAAAPPDSEPVKEYEYVALEGFNPSKAGELWELLEAPVSRGETSVEMAGRLGGSMVETDVGGKPVQLNTSALSVEKYWDGRVEVKIPIISDEAFNYTHSHATARILYEVWNSTRVRYYSVKNMTTLLNVTYRSLETNETLTRLIKPFLDTVAMLGDSTVAQGLSLNVSVPEHSQEIVTLVPEHVREFTVLFPKYRIRVEVLKPISPPNGSAWLVDESVWRPWFPVGSEVTITVCGIPNDPNAGYPYSDWIKEPLDAIVRVGSCEGFQVVGYDALHLTTSQPYGHFTLKAAEPGNHSVVLEAEGNAVFEGGSKDYAIPIEVVGPEHPCIAITILNVTGSTPGLVKLAFRVRNVGGSPTEAWFFPTYIDWDGELLDVLPWIWGWGPIYRLGVIPPGGSVDYAYTCLLAKHAIVEVIIIYGFPLSLVSSTHLYLNYAPPWVTGEEYLIAVPEYRDVPEHYDKLLVMIPVHEERMSVTIPGYTCLMRIRLQSLGVNTFENMLRSMLNRANMTASFILGETLLEGTIAPLSLTLPMLGVELEQGKKSPGEDASRYVMERVEQCFEDIGVVSEDQACSLLGVTRSMLRNGEIAGHYDVAFAYEAWVNSSTILMNSTLFIVYNHTISEYIRRNNLQDDLELCWRQVTNLTEIIEPSGESGNLTLIYRPLSTYGGELVRTVRVRNYAQSTMSYRLRVERYDTTVTDYMELFRVFITHNPRVYDWIAYLSMVAVYASTHPLKEEVETRFDVERGCRDALMVSSVSASMPPSTYFWYFIELIYGSNIVAMVAFRLRCEPDPFWQGFLEGLILDKGSSISISVAVLIVVALVPEAALVLSALSIGLKLIQLFTSQGPMLLNAFFTLGNLTLLGAICGANAVQCHLAGKHEFAAKALNLSIVISAKAAEVAEDTGLQLLFGISLDDVRIVLGQKEAGEREKGKAWGRVIGTIVECVAYIATFAILYDKLTKSVEAGQLSAKAILARVGKGLYNWVTPAVWDLAEFGIRVGAWAKGKLELRDVSNMLFADQVHKGFGETVGRAFKTLPDGGEPETVVKGVSEIVDKMVLDNEVPETVGKRMLNILKTVGEAYAGDKEWGVKVRNIADNIVEAWRRVRGLEAWEAGDEPGRLLTDWLENTPGEKVGKVVDVVQRLTGLSDDELNSLGKALAKVSGSFENGLKLFDTYFKTVKLDQYGEKIANTLAEAVSKNAEVLGVWSNAIEEGSKILVDISTRGEGDLNIEGRIGTDRGQILPGYYWIQVINEDSGNEVNEGLRNIGPPEGAIGLLHFEGVKGGDKYILILGSVTVENFFSRVKVKYIDIADKLRKGTVSDWLKDMYGLSGASFVRDGGDICLMIGGEKIAKVDAALGGTSSRIYLEFKITEPDSGEHIFHIGWRDGEATFDIILGKHHCPVMEFTQKAVRDSGGGVVARLLYIKYLETTEAGYREANTNFPVNREGFDWWSPKWSFSNTFITDEKIINIKTDSAWLQGPLKDIFGEEALRRLESVGVRVALVYQHEGKTALKFAKPSDLSVRDLPEDSKAIGFLVLRMDKEPSMRIGGVEIDFSGSLVEKTQITYSRDLTITKGSYSRALQADVVFTSPEDILVMKTEFGNLEILRKFWYDSDMESIVYRDFMRMGDVETAISDVIRFEILSDVPCLGDIALIQYAKDGETYNLIGGLTKELPETFTGIRSRATSHAWLVANYLKYELGKGYTEGWRVDNVEVNYEDMRFDVVAIKPDERKAIMEFKTIFEPNDADDLVKQAGRYLDVCKEDSGFAELIYVFQVDQNGEIPKKDVKALYNTLNEFLTTGKLRLTDGTVILDMIPEKAGRILEILIYTGGYVP